MNIELIELSREEYKKTFDYYFKGRIKLTGKWWKDPRGFIVGNQIFINDDAFFLFGYMSKLQLIAHEVGHFFGLKHSWKNPIMWRYGLLRP